MKTLFLFCISGICCLGSLNAQTSISLTFTASFDGHIPLDSIYVENITRGSDTTLYGNDTILVLSQGIGIESYRPDAAGSFLLYPAYPNPTSDHATITLSVPSEMAVTLRVFDIMGRNLTSASQTLPAGEHSFILYPGSERHLFIIAEVSGRRQVQQLISLRKMSGTFILTYNGMLPSSAGMRGGKSSFPWVPGDSLRYTGFSLIDTGITGHGLIADNPSQSQQYTFQIRHGIPCRDMPFVTDINGNVYNTVQIGTQCWMRENLRVINYNNGTPIPNLTGNSEWYNDTAGARCWYDNDSASFSQPYGSVYNFYAVNTGNLCPVGYHVPSDAEWQELEVFLGMDPLVAATYGLRGTVEGGKLKETGLLHWASPNAGATNERGFTALPAGGRFAPTGAFQGMAHNTYYVSTTPYSTTHHWGRGIGWNGSMIGRYDYLKNSGYAVRCVRD